MGRGGEHTASSMVVFVHPQKGVAVAEPEKTSLSRGVGHVSKDEDKSRSKICSKTYGMVGSVSLQYQVWFQLRVDRPV